MEIFPGIRMNASVRFGRPCVAGTRVDVATVLGALGNGDTIEEVCRQCGLDNGQIHAALRYAAHVVAHLPPAVAKAS